MVWSLISDPQFWLGDCWLDGSGSSATKIILWNHFNSYIDWFIKLSISIHIYVTVLGDVNSTNTLFLGTKMIPKYPLYMDKLTLSTCTSLKIKSILEGTLQLYIYIFFLGEGEGIHVVI